MTVLRAGCGTAGRPAAEAAFCLIIGEYEWKMRL